MSLPRTLACLESGLSQGLHIGAQVYVSVAGRAVADIAMGLARQSVLMRPETLMLWQSSSKPVAAVAIGQLWQRGKIQLDDSVAAHIPEFASHGKEAITIRHLLTHTAGIRGALLGWSSVPWDMLVARLCQARIEPGWIPGKKAGYHVRSTWVILGELVRRCDGRPFDRYARDEVFLPLNMRDTWNGMPVEAYRAYGDRIGFMHDTTQNPPLANFPNDTEAGCALCRPASNVHGPARELGRFYEGMLDALHGKPGAILWPQTIEAMTARHRVGLMDHTFRHHMDWGLGFMVDNNHLGVDEIPYSFGKYASPRTFGHGGSQSSVGMADPAHHLAAGVIFNGSCGEVAHHLRIRETLAALYEDLGLV